MILVVTYRGGASPHLIDQRRGRWEAPQSRAHRGQFGVFTMPIEWDADSISLDSLTQGGCAYIELSHDQAPAPAHDRGSQALPPDTGCAPRHPGRA